MLYYLVNTKNSIDSLIKLIPKEEQLPNVDFKNAPEGDSAR